jgi:hypothetical protein
VKAQVEEGFVVDSFRKFLDDWQKLPKDSDKDSKMRFYPFTYCAFFAAWFIAVLLGLISVSFIAKADYLKCHNGSNLFHVLSFELRYRFLVL